MLLLPGGRLAAVRLERLTERRASSVERRGARSHARCKKVKRRGVRERVGRGLCSALGARES
eukprot:457371-Rhodomonas_salina.2